MNREAILGVILAVVLLAVFGPKFFGSGNSGRDTVSEVQFVNLTGQINSVKAEYSTEKLRLISYQTAIKENNSWNYGAKREFVAETTTEAVIVVQAILGDPNEAFALINDNICSIGDRVLDYEVTAIDPINQTVTLRGPDSERIIPVSE